MNTVKQIRERLDGFTLIELLVVILIIGILLAIALPTFLNQQAKAHDADAKQALNTAYKVAKSESVDHDGKFVTSDYTITALTHAIHVSEPELTVAMISPNLDGTYSDLDTDTVYVDQTNTAGKDLVLVEESQSGSIITLSVVGDGAASYGTAANGSGQPPQGGGQLPPQGGGQLPPQGGGQLPPQGGGQLPPQGGGQ